MNVPPGEMADHKEIEERQNEHDERHHEAEEHEGDHRALAAIAGSRQLVARIFGFQDDWRG